ncbi:hypothetical protein ACFX1Z_038039 [Malus domestica]
MPTISRVLVHPFALRFIYAAIIYTVLSSICPSGTGDARQPCQEESRACRETNQPNVKGLVLASSADLKSKLRESGNFDPHLQAKVLKVVDVSYGGEDGFNQAVKLLAEFLSNVKFIQEHNLLGRHLEEVNHGRR